MLVHLKSIGSIDVSKQDGDSDDAIERPAMLVYCGEFESADGPVKVTHDHLKLLVSNHNSAMSKLKRLAAGSTPLKHYPPIQLDHSTSARDTVGRLVGDLTLGEHELEDGTKVPAVFSRLRVLGKENVEKVRDGRWADLSVGADFDIGKLHETSITPFPAAPGSSMLSAGKTKNSLEHAMDEKLKGYLTGHKKMSEKEAEEHLSRLSKPEHEEEMKKLALEFDDWAKEEKKEHDKKLTAAREGLTRLTASFKDASTKARLQAATGKVITRLSRLRASGKVTPAEIKKMDIAKLSASSDKEIDLVLGTYEAREPVIMAGQYGTVKGTNVSELTAKQKEERKAKLEAETRANMSLLRGEGAHVKMSGGPGGDDVRTEDGAPPPVTTEQDHEKERMAYMEAEHAEIHKLYSNGQHDEAKARLKSFMAKHLAAGGGHHEMAEISHEETEKHLSALAQSVDQMQAQFEEITKLTATVVA